MSNLNFYTMLLSKSQKKSLSVARTLSRAFQIRIEIRLFGKLVFSYVWPPDEVIAAELNDLNDGGAES